MHDIIEISNLFISVSFSLKCALIIQIDAKQHVFTKTYDNILLDYKVNIHYYK